MAGASRRPPPECANCGEAIPPTARACPHCGADERTGWREQDVYDGLDLPGGAWDEETPTKATRGARTGLAWYWVVAGVLVLLALGLTVLGLR